jgi:hypothetical protein
MCLATHLFLRSERSISVTAGAFRCSRARWAVRSGWLGGAAVDVPDARRAGVGRALQRDRYRNAAKVGASVRPAAAMAAVQPRTTVPDGILRLCRPTLSRSKRVHACCPGTPGLLAQCIKHGCAIRSLGELNPHRSCGRDVRPVCATVQRILTDARWRERRPSARTAYAAL